MANSEIDGVTVSQNPDNKAKYRINICTHDRNNLLWEVTNRCVPHCLHLPETQQRDRA